MRLLGSRPSHTDTMIWPQCDKAGPGSNVCVISYRTVHQHQTSISHRCVDMSTSQAFSEVASIQVSDFANAAAGTCSSPV